MKKILALQLLEDYFNLSKRIATTSSTSSVHKTAKAALANTDKRLNMALDEIADNAKPIEVLYEQG